MIRRFAVSALGAAALLGLSALPASAGTVSASSGGLSATFHAGPHHPKAHRVAVAAEGVGRTFGRLQALRDVDLRVAPGEMLAVTGPSGSGKSTLLNLIGGLDQPDTGRILIDGHAVWDRAKAEVVRARRELVG